MSDYINNYNIVKINNIRRTFFIRAGDELNDHYVSPLGLMHF